MAKNRNPSKAEVLFNDYQESRGLGLIWGKTLPFYDYENKSSWNFECDFLNPTDSGSFDIDFEIDGEHYHRTKVVNGIQVSAGTDAWKDAVKNANGLKVIHIPAPIVEKKFWSYLDEMIPKARIDRRGSVIIPA